MACVNGYATYHFQGISCAFYLNQEHDRVVAGSKTFQEVDGSGRVDEWERPQLGGLRREA